MVEVIEKLLQRYGTLTLVIGIISGVGGALWWVVDQTHRIKSNETEISEIKSELAGRQNITPIAERLLMLESKWEDVRPLIQRLTILEAEQAHLMTEATRFQGILERMTDRLNIIDRRLAETSINVTSNQEIARKILDQQTAITATITDIKRGMRGAK